MLSQSATQLLLTRTSHGGAPAVQADVATATLAELAMVSDVFTAAWGAKRRVALMGAEALTVRMLFTLCTTTYGTASRCVRWTHLSGEQREVFRLVEAHLRLTQAFLAGHGNRPPPLQLMVCGTAGTGKTYLICALGVLLGSLMKTTATTGKASSSIAGMTIHTGTCLPPTAAPRPCPSARTHFLQLTKPAALAHTCRACPHDALTTSCEATHQGETATRAQAGRQQRTHGGCELCRCRVPCAGRGKACGWCAACAVRM